VRYFEKEKLLRQKAEAQASLGEESSKAKTTSLSPGSASDDESSEREEYTDWKSKRMVGFGDALSMEKDRI
jgi:hypothetical protein